MSELSGFLPAFDALANETLFEVNRILPELAQSAIPRSPWRKIIPFKDWEDEMGFSVFKAVIRQNVPDQNATWQANAASTAASTPGGGNQFDNNNYNTYLIDNGVDKYQVTPKTVAFVSNEFGLEDVRASVSAMSQLVGFTDAFQDGVYEAMDVQIRKDHFLAADNLYYIVEGASGLQQFEAKDHTTGLATAGGLNVEATGHISMPLLGLVYGMLVSSPAAKFPIGMTADGDRVFPLIVDPSVKETLINTNDRVEANINFAWMGSQEGSPESQQPTKAFTYKGWYIETDYNLPRLKWNATTNSYVLVPKWAQTGASGIGNKSIVNPDWKTAEYGFSVVPTPLGFEELVKKPANYKDMFVPQTYTGEIRVLNIKDRAVNPLGDKAVLHSLASLAPVPVFPDTLYWLIHTIDTNVSAS